MPAALALALPLLLQAAPAAVETAPMTVRVEVSPAADAAVQEWAKELRAALGARRDEFRLARASEAPEFVVRIDSIGKAQDGTPLMNGALVLGETKRPFNYGFRDVKAQAEALARNLRRYADQMKANPAGS